MYRSTSRHHRPRARRRHTPVCPEHGQPITGRIGTDPVCIKCAEQRITEIINPAPPLRYGVGYDEAPHSHLQD